MKRFARMTISQEEHSTNVERMAAHVREFSGWFNAALETESLGLRLDPASMEASVRALPRGRLAELVRSMGEHAVHKEQVQTAAEVIGQMIRQPGKSGVIIGALQSGKTGSAFATLFAAPMMYLKTGVRFVPLFLTTNQISHMDQTKKAMRSFFNLYGDIEITSGGFDAARAGTLLDFYAEAGYDLDADEEPADAVTLRGYSSAMVDEIAPGEDVVSAIVNGMTFKRVGGREISHRMRAHCDRARAAGSAVLLIVDEPQYGASDTVDKDAFGLKPCLLSRVFREVDEDFFSRETPNMMVGLSATPFDTYGMSNLFMVRQRLADGYVGPNCFGGLPIDQSVRQRMPKMLSFSDLSGAGESMKDFGEINYLLGIRKHPVDKDFCARTSDGDGRRRAMTPLEREVHGTAMLRELLDASVLSRRERRSAEGSLVGAVVRLSSSIGQTERIVDNLDIDGPNSPYNVIRFYGEHGDDEKGKVEAIIRRATRNDDRPYVFLVVGKGRMGDAFPSSAEVGIDLTQSPSDMNALLQGVFGRMCGYGKDNATVIMSDESVDAIAEYVDSVGKTDVLKQSRHGQVSKRRPGRRAAQNWIKFTDEMIELEPIDSPLRTARQEFERYLAYLNEPTSSPRVPRRRGEVSKYFPLGELMGRTGLVEYVAEHASRIDPTVKGVPQILPVGGSYVRHKDGVETVIRYSEDPANPDSQELLVTRVSEAYRKARAESRSGAGIGDRGLVRALTQGYADATSKAPRGNYVGYAMPVLEVIKVDPLNASKVVGFDEHGRYVFAAMTFHLENEVVRKETAEFSFLPSATHAARHATTDMERARVLEATVSKALGPRSQPELGELLASPEAFEIIGLMHDAATHTWTCDDTSVTFSDIATGEVDNPWGPAVVEFGGAEPVLTYARKGFIVEAGDLSGGRSWPDGEKPETSSEDGELMVASL